MSAMEYGDRDDQIGQFAILIPDAQLQEVKNKGFDHIRVPLRWERIERTGARDVLDPVGWGNFIDLLNRCKAIRSTVRDDGKGLKVIPDIHNFGALGPDDRHLEPAVSDGLQHRLEL
jgi:aryl-phospho-beta-D-glucosidase BglC (GH1 family)